VRITNVSPVGDLWVPDLRRIVESGETIAVADDLGANLTEQPANWAPAGADEGE
jgi:hypothetical protein